MNKRDLDDYTLYFIKTEVASVAWGPKDLDSKEGQLWLQNDLGSALAADAENYVWADEIVDLVNDDAVDFEEVGKYIGDFENYYPHVGDSSSIPDECFDSYDINTVNFKECLYLMFDRMNMRKQQDNQTVDDPCDGKTVEIDGKKYKLTLVDEV